MQPKATTPLEHDPLCLTGLLNPATMNFGCNLFCAIPPTASRQSLIAAVEPVANRQSPVAAVGGIGDEGEMAQ
jgi:hypothetical protein